VSTPVSWVVRPSITFSTTLEMRTSRDPGSLVFRVTTRASTRDLRLTMWGRSGRVVQALTKGSTCSKTLLSQLMHSSERGPPMTGPPAVAAELAAAAEAGWTTPPSPAAVAAAFAALLT